MDFSDDVKQKAASAFFDDQPGTQPSDVYKPLFVVDKANASSQISDLPSPPSSQQTILSQLSRYVPKFKTATQFRPQLQATAKRYRHGDSVPATSQPLSQLAQVEQAFEAIFASQKEKSNKAKAALPATFNPLSALSQQSRNGCLFKTPYRSKLTSEQTAILDNTDVEVPAKKACPLYASPQPLTLKCGSNGAIMKLKAVTEIPERFRRVFAAFPYFNITQSQVFEDVLYTDKSIVVCAPTGSGKTVIFELAIIRLLMKYTGELTSADFKIVYMAPIKALCGEKMAEWTEKFSALGIKCTELTGDTDGDEYFQLQKSHIVLTTPEKWDSFTRRWRDNKSLVKLVRLFLIDEVHLLNDDVRGPTMEAVVSRMKTVEAIACREMQSHLRFIAVSATVPNVTDISAWLGVNGVPALHFKASDETRPVRLKKIVYDYPCNESWTDFKFDLSLSYKLRNIIYNHAEGKPTLVFCSTRKGVVQTASVLAKDTHTFIESQQLPFLQRIANSIKDSKLRDVLPCGVAFHHAGLDAGDRRLIEDTFAKGELPILICTSTLAMGVNLPAHLVIVKSTTQYAAGRYVEYTETQILQMIGRAGRPQYKYESLVGGTQLIESSLHKHLIEHVNAEIVLRTITDVSIALEWIRSTFLYIRVMKNPKHYGLQENMTKDQTENKLLEMCVKDLNALAECKFIEMGDDGFELGPTEVGRMMARYCIAFDSMKSFTQMTGRENLNDLVVLVSSCKEFSDIQLRVSEKKTLNTLNKDKHNPTIRYAMEGKIKNKEMKVNCLIQAVFGSILIHEPGLNQEALKIIRIGQRITKCLAEYANLRNEYRCVLNCVLLAKCFNAKLWDNSKHVARQLDKLGITLTNTLVNAGMTSFQKLADINPRQLEMILNRNPPFGSQIQDAIALLPKFDVLIEQNPHYNADVADLTVSVVLVNWNELQKRPKGIHFKCTLLIGDADNKLVFRSKLARTAFVQSQQWVRKIEIYKASKGTTLHINLINEDLVGLDIQCTFSPFYTGWKRVTVGRNYETLNVTENADPDVDKSDEEIDVVPNDEEAKELPISETNRECNHRCNDKNACSHTCCKVGVVVKPKKNLEPQQLKIDRFVDELHQKASLLSVPVEQKKFNDKPQSNVFQTIQKFQFIPRSKGKLQFSHQRNNYISNCVRLHEEASDGNDLEASAPIWPEVKQAQDCRQSSDIDLYDIIDLDSDEDTSALIVYNGDGSMSSTLPPLNSLQNVNSCDVEDFQDTDNLLDGQTWDMGIDELFFDSPDVREELEIKHPESPSMVENPEDELATIPTRKPIQHSPISHMESSCISTDTGLSQATSKYDNMPSPTNMCFTPSSGFTIKDRKSVFTVPTYHKENELEETLKLFHNIFDGLV